MPSKPRTIADIPEDIRDFYLWWEYPDSEYYGWLYHEVTREYGTNNQSGRACPGCGSDNTGHTQTTYYCGLVCNDCSLKFTHEEAYEVEWEKEHPADIIGYTETEVQRGILREEL